MKIFSYNIFFYLINSLGGYNRNKTLSGDHESNIKKVGAISSEPELYIIIKFGTAKSINTYLKAKIQTQTLYGKFNQYAFMNFLT